MSEPDYYALIGVERGAPLQEIRTKFRQKVLAEHPDKGGDPKKFQQLNKAYNVLTDPQKRKRYDTTGRAEKTAEEEFVEGFRGGSWQFEQRSKDADREAVVNLQDRIQTGAGNHTANFEEWLRQRDQSSMVLTDKDFMKTALFNAAELSKSVEHKGPVQHVLGSPKVDAYGQSAGGAVQVQAKRQVVKKSIEHDELVLRIMAVPVDDAMIYADLDQSKVCLGMTGVGRVEQVGSRIEELRQEDTVLVVPKPTKFSPQKPIGTARTLLTCNEEDLIKVPSEILEELTPEQICLTPTIVCAYILLETYGSKLKPGDSVLLNGAHLSASGSSLLQLCKLLKLKPFCIVSLQGAPRCVAKGEYGSKSAWEGVETRSTAPPSVRATYDRISERLLSMGAEEIFPDAPALLRWRDRNQRMLPKLALDGVATRDSCEQLIHCLQSGDKGGNLVVYGHGSAQPLEISPPLIAAWGGNLVGFNIARWVHALSKNAEKMMEIMANVTKLVRANNFTLETALCKVGRDDISEAFDRASDRSSNAQVVLSFPSLEEEKEADEEAREQEKKEKDAQQKRAMQKREADEKKQAEEDERDKLKREWLEILFTPQSVAATENSGESPLARSNVQHSSRSSCVIFWIGDDPAKEVPILKDAVKMFSSATCISLAWNDHPAGEGLKEVDVSSQQVTDGSWYQRSRAGLENEDLDLLHDVEVLGRAMMQTIKKQVEESRLTWRNVIIAGFGKGAGIALYAALLRLFPSQVNAMMLFAPVVPFPTYLSEKLQGLPKAQQMHTKVFALWGGRDRSTPGSYRETMKKILSKTQEVHFTSDNVPEAEHSFDDRSIGLLESLLGLCVR